MGFSTIPFVATTSLLQILSWFKIWNGRVCAEIPVSTVQIYQCIYTHVTFPSSQWGSSFWVWFHLQDPSSHELFNYIFERFIKIRSARQWGTLADAGTALNMLCGSVENRIHLMVRMREVSLATDNTVINLGTIAASATPCLLPLIGMDKVYSLHNVWKNFKILAKIQASYLILEIQVFHLIM